MEIQFLDFSDEYGDDGIKVQMYKRVKFSCVYRNILLVDIGVLLF